MMLRASGGADGRIAGEPIERVARRVIAAQQRFRPAAFTYDVMKKFGDDDTGTLDSSLAFSTFVCVFRLLLVLITVLNIMLAGDQ